MSDILAIHTGNAATASSRDLTVAADDGRALAATLFEPAGRLGTDAPVTVIAGGAAIPRRFYARFAQWLAAERGRPVLIFDYRDVGGSRQGSLVGSRVRMRDWCGLDVPGVLSWASRTYPDRPIHWIGHSMGGFATGLAHNNRLIARQLNIATLSGYWRHMAVPERYRVFALMGGFAPVAIHALGYFPGKLMGGEDMPGPAFLEWRGWCMTPDFLFGDPTLPDKRFVPALRAPIRFTQVEDDVWGTPAAVASIAGHFTGSVDRSIWPVRLADAGARRIGHFGFFREEFRDTLWPAAAAWLDTAAPR